MENKLSEEIETTTYKKSFIKKYIVGVIIFCVWVFVAFLNMLVHITRPDEAFVSFLIDVVSGVIIGSIIQLIFTSLKKLFVKK